MEMTLVFGPSQHQSEHSRALEAGLRALGVRTRRAHKRDRIDTDLTACWGWHTGAFLRRKGHHVLVLERGYMGDRFAWTSLAWDGLNGLGQFPRRESPERFERFFQKLLRPFRHERGEYILIIGQVPRDASLRGRDMRPWYVEQAQLAQEAYGLPVYFRPHPKAPPGAYTKHLPYMTGRLDDALANAHAVITYNSNTAVESTLAGVHTVAEDAGSMAYDVAAHAIGQEMHGDRETWAHRVAWRQWRVEELRNGDALRIALEGLL